MKFLKPLLTLSLLAGTCMPTVQAMEKEEAPYFYDHPADGGNFANEMSYELTKFITNDFKHPAISYWLIKPKFIQQDIVPSEIKNLNKGSNKVLVSSTCPNTVQIFDKRIKKCLAILQHPETVYLHALNDTGDKIITFCRDEYIYLWDIETQETLARIRYANPNALIPAPFVGSIRVSFNSKTNNFFICSSTKLTLNNHVRWGSINRISILNIIDKGSQKELIDSMSIDQAHLLIKAYECVKTKESLDLATLREQQAFDQLPEEVRKMMKSKIKITQEIKAAKSQSRLTQALYFGTFAAAGLLAYKLSK